MTLWDYIHEVTKEMNRTEEYKSQQRRAELYEKAQTRCEVCGGMPKDLPKGFYDYVLPCDCYVCSICGEHWPINDKGFAVPVRVRNDGSQERND